MAEGNEQQPSVLDPNLAGGLYRALTGGSEELYEFVQDSSMEVLQAALKNPAFSESHLQSLLKRRDLSDKLIRAITAMHLFEESRTAKAAVFRNPATPSHSALSIIPQLYLFELVDMILLPGLPPDHRVAAERAVIKRIPSLPLGNKLTLAHRGTAAIVEALLEEGDPRVVEACLASPRLKEVAVCKFLNGQRGTAESISAIARHERWKGRPAVRRAILRNGKTPPVWFTVWLPALSLAEMRELETSGRLNQSQKAVVAEELHKRTGNRKK